MDREGREERVRDSGIADIPPLDDTIADETLESIEEGDEFHDANDPDMPDETPAAGTVRDEVLVRFVDARKRDLAMVNSVNLADRVNPSGKPTAGIRLEIPAELTDTFRLLARFGTRLRARHGNGTKRHVKFDDFTGSLFTNIKLPGDTTWTRVTPEMARRDLKASINEESEANQRRLASKLIPGPRERLGRPLSIPKRPRSAALASSTVRTGQRPSWSGPARGIT